MKKFSIIFNKVKYEVSINTFNDRYTTAKVFDPSLEMTFTGRARCNTELDSFEEITGEHLALTRALKKRSKVYSRIEKEVQNSLTKDLIDANAGIMHRCVKYWRKQARKEAMGPIDQLMIEE